MCLARSTAGNVLALCRSLATSDAGLAPSPVGTATLAAKNVNVSTARCNSAADARYSEAGDGDAGGRSSSGRTILVVLLDDDTVFGNVGQSNARVRDSADFTGGAVDGLDADAVVRVDDFGVEEFDVGDGVVVAPADRTNGQTVAAGARTSTECDVGSTVDSDAIVLIVNDGIGNGDTSRRTNIKSIRVVAERVTRRTVNGNLVHGELSRAIDGESLHRRVLDGQAVNGRVCHAVSVKELGLCLAAIAAFAVPPAGAVAVQHTARGAGHGDGVAGDGDERAFPLFVAECGGSLSDQYDFPAVALVNEPRR